MTNPADIVCLTETWLNENFSENSINLPGYSIVRNDRQGRTGGGVLIAVSHHWNYSVYLIPNDFEVIWIICRNTHMPRRYSHVAIAVIYHCPGANNKLLQHHILSTADCISSKHPNCLFLITGDFNHFKDKLITSFPLKQIISKKTRGESFLDRIYTNDDSIYNKEILIPAIGKSDHNAVFVSPSAISASKPIKSYVYKRNFSSEIRQLILNDIRSINWTPLFQLQTCNDQLELFYFLIMNIIDSHSPFQKEELIKYEKPWVTKKFINLIRKRQRAFMSGDYNTYKQYRNYIIRFSKRLKRNYYMYKKEKICTVNSKNWWKLTNELLDTSDNNFNIKMLIKEKYDDNESLFTEKANNFFASLSSKCTPIEDCTPSVNVLDDVDQRYIISPRDVLKQLLQVCVNKSAGPDGIPNWVLKEAANTLYLPISAIFNSSLREGFVPSVWKAANVTLIAKKSKVSNLEKDLRPISITSTLGKILEFFVCNYIVSEVEDKLDPHQYGCLPGRSTTLALLSMAHQWFKALDERKAVRVLLVDYEKAFDTVDHSLLIQRMIEFGMSNTLLSWMKSFLSGRKQRVGVNGRWSEWILLKGGIPQGSRLGPICYIISNDSLRSTSNNAVQIHKYVDDTTITEIFDKLKTSNLQTHADNLCCWTLNNRMKINVEKTVACTFTLSTNKNFDVKHPPICIDDKTITEVSEFKLLGIWFSNNCKWNKHINEITNRANYRLLFLRRLKRAGFGTQELLHYYLTCIRPILEYACPLWHSMLTEFLKEQLEIIQTRALRIVFNTCDTETHVNTFKIPSLFDRREKLCKKLFKRLITRKTECAIDLQFEERSVRELRKAERYIIPSCRTATFANSFIPYSLSKFQPV